MSLEQQYQEISKKRARKAKRRQMAESLRDIREKTAQKQFVSPEYSYELLFIFCRNQLSLLSAIPFITVLFIVYLGRFADEAQLFTWAGVVLGAKCFLVWLCRSFISRPIEHVPVNSWLLRIGLLEMICGICFSGFLFIGVNTEESHALFTVFAVILVFLSMRMMYASTVPMFFYVGTAPIFLALFLKFHLTNNASYLTMAYLFLVLYVCCSIYIRQMHLNILDMLSTRSEKDFLISEIEEAKAFSDEARRLAEEANIAKSRFLATMSHELRTPLNAILGFSEVMKDELFGTHKDQRYKEYSADIHTSGEHLLNLINEILDLSRIEAGRYELHEETIQLSDIASDCCRLLQLKAEKKQLEVVQDYEDENLKLWADERAVRQIIINLLSNAIKFTPQGGVIKVSILVNPERELVLSVKDTGPGIPADEIPKILTNFGQGSLAHETAEGGSGLGLPIVKGLIDIHGGVFNLESKLRKGTEVIIRFPARRVTQVLSQIPVKEIKKFKGASISRH